MPGTDPIGLVGLGLMGTAMSGRLLAAGRAVVGCDPSPAARDAHVARGGTVVDTAADVASGCDVVLLSLPNGEVSQEVCLGRDGVAAGARDGTVVVDTSTTLPEQAEAVAEGLAPSGVTFLDAALSGYSGMVARGDVLAMVGGDATSVARVEDVLAAFCREIRHVGGTGDGMRAKLVVNEVLSLNRYALAEGLVLAEKVGLDPAQMLAVLQASAAHSTAMDMWGRRMVEHDYAEPASRISTHDKDAQLILDLGRRNGAPLPAQAQLNGLVRAAIANGHGDRDNAVIVEVLRTLAGVSDLSTARSPVGPGRPAG
ncbi:MAG: NAD-binding protein [Streptosporangiales bacterium]|nr:NAD-binding protein [Streptosporangiales bacterium]